jgi:rhodanese-related sulfurtransferase
LNKILLGIFIFAQSISTYGQVEIFEFRNDFRPGYDNTLSIEQLADLQKEGNIIVLDVRLEEDFALDPTLISGAEYKNPEILPTWINQIDKSKEVVVYCVAGRWVSQKVAHLLDEAGINVRSLEGGLEAWKEKQDQ